MQRCYLINVGHDLLDAMLFPTNLSEAQHPVIVSQPLIPYSDPRYPSKFHATFASLYGATMVSLIVNNM